MPTPTPCPPGPGPAEHVDWALLRKDLQFLAKTTRSFAFMLRLSWHDSGTWSQCAKNGGPHACQRFIGCGEAVHEANAGLSYAVQLYEGIVKKYPNVSVADIWALGAIVAIEEAGGPKVPFRAGRTDCRSWECGAPEGRLPDGEGNSQHLRVIFYRMGFNDEELVALSGGHTLGSCNIDRSGFLGPWTMDPKRFDNTYFTNLFEREWTRVRLKESDKRQFVERDGKGLMMLNTDIALRTDPKFRVIARKYADSQEVFFASFAKAFQKLQELGYSNLQEVSFE